jgi:hypothetical protein
MAIEMLSAWHLGDSPELAKSTLARHWEERGTDALFDLVIGLTALAERLLKRAAEASNTETSRLLRSIASDAAS